MLFCHSFGMPAAAAATAVQAAPRTPVLIGKAVNPILRLEFEADESEVIRITGFRFRFEATDAIDDIAEVMLFETGADGELPAGKPFARIRPIESSFSIPAQFESKKGRRVVWVACVVNPDADLTHHVALSCISIETDNGPIVPKRMGTIRPQRLGFALRQQGQDDVHTYRIPALTTSKAGTLLCVYDMRRRMGRDLQEDIDIGLSRSVDGGRTWETPRVIMDMGEYGGLPQELNGCSDPGIVVDRETGTIFCFAVWMHGKPGKHQWRDDGSEPGFEIGKAAQMLMTTSTDDGKTWSKPENLTRKIKREEWWLLAPAPQSGFQLADGTLVMPLQGRTGREDKATFATVMTSRDHGKSWSVGNFGYEGGNECQAALIGDGSLMLNVRNDLERFRAVVVSKDLGKSWTPHQTNRNTLIEPNCNGSLIRIDFETDGKPDHALLFANPHSQKGRTHHTLQLSRDDGLTWPERFHVLLDEGRGAGYPSLTQIDKDFVGIVYEGSQAHLTFQKFRISELIAPSRPERTESTK